MPRGLSIDDRQVEGLEIGQVMKDRSYRDFGTLVSNLRRAKVRIAVVHKFGSRR